MKKTVLITGCNRGLGKQLLTDFAKESYDCITITRSHNAEFDDFCNELTVAHKINISQYYADFLSEESLTKVLNEIQQSEIEIDVLINNAGINPNAQPIFYMDYKDVETAFKVNYFAPFLITKHIASLMIRRGKGSIIDITSTVSINIEPGECAYGASKAALNLSIQTLAQELAPFKVRINGIACGILNSDMFHSLEDKTQKKFLKRVATKRPAELHEISEVALFLASDKSSYITGSILKVDGGFV